MQSSNEIDILQVNKACYIKRNVESQKKCIISLGLPTM